MIEKEDRPARTLSTAEERRAAVLQAAMPAFAQRGYYGTPTAEVAKRAGISQAYVFRLFPTKEELFVAAIGYCTEQILASFRRAVGDSPGGSEHLFKALGLTYADLMRDRDLLMVQLHAQSASGEPAIREALRRSLERQVEFVRSMTGGTDEQVQDFFAVGMLSHLILAVDAQTLDDRWARTLVGTLFFHRAG